MICRRRAPISFITPICGICWVISADMALTTRKPDSSRMTRPNPVRISTTVSIRRSAWLWVMISRLRIVRPELQLVLDLGQRGQDVLSSCAGSVARMRSSVCGFRETQTDRVSGVT